MGLHLFSALLLTLVIGFLLPAVGLGLVLAALSLGACSPLAALSLAGKDHLVDFLITFGAGDMVQGVMIICLTISIVGGLFEMLNLYKYVYLR